MLAKLHAKYEAARTAAKPSPASIRQARMRYWQATGLAKAGLSAAELAAKFGFKVETAKRKRRAVESAAAEDTRGMAEGHEVDDELDCEEAGEADADAAVASLPTASTWLREAVLQMARPSADGARGKVILFAHHVREQGRTTLPLSCATLAPVADSPKLAGARNGCP